jgi:hypothetical protein
MEGYATVANMAIYDVECKNGIWSTSMRDYTRKCEN